MKNLVFKSGSNNAWKERKTEQMLGNTKEVKLPRKAIDFWSTSD